MGLLSRRTTILGALAVASCSSTSSSGVTLQTEAQTILVGLQSINAGVQAAANVLGQTKVAAFTANFNNIVGLLTNVINSTSSPTATIIGTIVSIGEDIYTSLKGSQLPPAILTILDAFESLLPSLVALAGIVGGPKSMNRAHKFTIPQARAILQVNAS